MAEPTRTVHKDVLGWTRRYARSRALPMLAGLLLFGFLVLPISLFSKLSHEAAAVGDTRLYWVWRGLSLSFAATLVLALTPRGRRIRRWLVETVSERLYGEEGRVLPEGCVETESGSGARSGRETFLPLWSSSPRVPRPGARRLRRTGRLGVGGFDDRIRHLRRGGGAGPLRPGLRRGQHVGLDFRARALIGGFGPHLLALRLATAQEAPR